MPCRFCDLHGHLRRSAWTAPAVLCLDGDDEFVVAAGPSAAIVVARGSLAPGNLMIIPSVHHHSLFELSDKERTQMLILARGAAVLVSKIFGQACYVEHGAVDEGEFVGGCISHCHINIFPIAVSETVTQRVGIASSICATNSKQLLTDSGPYLVFGDHVSAGSVGKIENTKFIRNEQIPSQLVRRWWAEEISPAVDYDWRLNPHVGIGLRTFELCQEFSSGLHELAADMGLK